MSDSRLQLTIASLGTLVTAAAIVWWWAVFSQVVTGDYLTYGQAATCLVGSTDLCTLAQALCQTDHLFALRTYVPEVFWAGGALIATSLILTARSIAR